MWPLLGLDGVLDLSILLRIATTLYLFLFSPVCCTGAACSVSAGDTSFLPPLPPDSVDLSSESSFIASPRSSLNTESKVSDPVSAPVSCSGNRPESVWLS